jgi:microcystin-dependent protein
MSEPFLSELKCVSFGFPPKGWALCDGQLLPINQNQALFSLLGTTYGGDGRVNFGLPNLQGRAPMHMGDSHTLGERGGEMNHTLSISEIPTHIHFVQAINAAAGTGSPGGNLLANTAGGGLAIYIPPTNLTAMNPGSVSNVGGNQPHVNMQPFLTMNWIIALQGIFPSQN